LIYQALEKKEKVSLDEIEVIKKRIKNQELNVITILDSEYPEALKFAYKPPFVIFYKGDLEILKNKFINLTGNYNNENSKAKIEESLVGLDNKLVIISSA
jgi:DNA processing protein